jgi:diguanylate cyclase (GGDEF)-like protein
VTLYQSQTDGASVLAERWRSGVESEKFEILDGRRVTVSISMGIASYDPSMQSPDELIEAADRALYEAKSNGRNRICCYDPSS